MKSKFTAILLIITILLGSFETYYTFAATKSELNIFVEELKKIVDNLKG